MSDVEHLILEKQASTITELILFLNYPNFYTNYSLEKAQVDVVRGPLLWAMSMTEDEMVGWHHRLNGHGFGWTPGAGDGQGGLACCGSWGHRESHTTEQLN